MIIEDEVVIPNLSFNIETNYSTLIGKTFSSDKQNTQSERDWKIEQAWQRTAFILDELGAEIESEVSFSVDGALAAEPDTMNEKPKKMIFDKPFLILLKRTDAKNPYFGLWVTNTELMKKE